MNVGELEQFKLLRNVSHSKKGQGNQIGHYPNVRLNKTFSGRSGFMCPDCYHVEIRKLCTDIHIHVERRESDDTNITTSMNIIMTCRSCGERNNMITLDPNIAYAVGLLNQKGYKTKFCCEGHGTRSAYISFKKNAIDEDVLSLLPITWYIDRKNMYYRGNKIVIENGRAKLKLGTKKDFYVDDKIIIRSDECNYKEAMLDIYEWAEMLPEKKGDIK